ncbi:MAG TPA: SDR family oxidoreductase [Symbiobacteriaceae bacterium]|nr:SDR family oxidoreductase [Symbiobacteriaceae bacterium]
MALVTGGNGGIGRAIALTLAKAGADVAIIGRNEAKTAAVVAEIVERGRRAVGLTCDVTDRAAIRTTVEQVVQHLGSVTILVNNAGIVRPGSPLKKAPEEWDQVLSTNLDAPFFFAQAVYPAMAAAGGGSIINISSISSVVGQSYNADYNAAKAGLDGLTRSLAVAWAKKGIRVNSLLPGWVLTEMTESAAADPAWLAAQVARIPLGRFAGPEEMTGAVLFLASSASSYMTGASLVIDGGLTVG